MFPRLYAILDVEMASARGLAPRSLVDAWLSAGVRLIQLRAKTQGTGAMVDLADWVAGRCHQSGARLIVNDRIDVALMAGADGVHVGQTDLPPLRVRSLMPSPRWIGCSTHTLEQIELAVREPVDYVAFGPVFSTSSKRVTDPLVGLDGLARAAARVSDADLPLVAIGGITLDRVPGVIAAGASAVAVISDLLMGDIEGSARAYLDALA